MTMREARPFGSSRTLPHTSVYRFSICDLAPVPNHTPSDLSLCIEDDGTQASRPPPLARERQRGKKGGGGQNITRRPPTENNFQTPSHLGTFCPFPAIPISLIRSPRNSQNFPHVSSPKTILGGRAIFSRGFAFGAFAFPPPLALPTLVLDSAFPSVFGKYSKGTPKTKFSRASLCRKIHRR